MPESGPYPPARRTRLPDPERHSELPRRLMIWFQRFGRKFPWRKTRDPFHVLTAELMLQRTRADQVEPVWTRFVADQGAPADVVRSGREVVDRAFAPLGLHWRADRYWALCRELVAEYGGDVPADREALMSLPGVGQYAAGMTLTNAFWKPAGAVDSNILRIYGRYFGIEFNDSDRRRRAVLAWADALVPGDPAEACQYNLALVDLGALICTPRNPKCGECPLRETCKYAVENLPEPAKKG